MHPSLKRPLQDLNNPETVPLHSIQRWLKRHLHAPANPLNPLHAYINQHPDFELRNNYHLCMSYASRENLTAHKLTPQLFALNLLIRSPTPQSPIAHTSSDYIADFLAIHLSQHLPTHLQSEHITDSIKVFPSLIRTEELAHLPPSQLFSLFQEIQLWSLNATPASLQHLLQHPPAPLQPYPHPPLPTTNTATAPVYDDYTLFFALNTDETTANDIEDTLLRGTLLNSELTLFSIDSNAKHHTLPAHVSDASTPWNIAQTGAYSALCLQVIGALQHFDPRTPEGAISCAFFYPPGATNPSVRFAQSSGSTLLPGPTYHNILQPDKLVEKLYVCTRTHQLHDPILCPYIPTQPLSDLCFYSKSTWVTVNP